MLPARFAGYDGNLPLVSTTLTGQGKGHLALPDEVVTREGVLIIDPYTCGVLVDDIEGEGLIPNRVAASIDGRPRPERLATAGDDNVGVLLAKPVLVLEALAVLDGQGESAGSKGHTRAWDI